MNLHNYTFTQLQMCKIYILKILKLLKKISMINKKLAILYNHNHTYPYTYKYGYLHIDIYSMMVLHTWFYSNHLLLLVIET